MGLTVLATGSCGSDWGNRESSSETFRGECLGRLCKVINLSISGGWKSERLERRYSSCNAGCASAFGLWALQDVGSLSLLVGNVGCRCLTMLRNRVGAYPTTHQVILAACSAKAMTSWKPIFSALPPVLFLLFFKMSHPENMGLNHAGICSAW